jgi:hypothetical protein
MFNGLFFFELLTPFTLGGYNFLILNPFSMIISVLHVLKGGVQVLWVNIKNYSFYKYFFWCLSCPSCDIFYIYMILYKCFGGVYVYTSYIINDGTYLQSILISCESFWSSTFFFYNNGSLWLALHKNNNKCFSKKSFYYQVDVVEGLPCSSPIYIIEVHTFR